MKGVLFLFTGLLMFLQLWADMPGNKPRSEVSVLVLLGDLEDYTLYSNGPYSAYGEDQVVTDSSEHILSGGFGAPPCVTFFGVNKQEKHTDSMHVCNYEQGHVQLRLSVKDGKLVSEELNLPYKKDETVPVITGQSDQNHTRSSFFRKPINMLVISAFVSMIMLVGWYFITQRKKQEL